MPSFAAMPRHVATPVMMLARRRRRAPRQTRDVIYVSRARRSVERREAECFMRVAARCVCAACVYKSGSSLCAARCRGAALARRVESASGVLLCRAVRLPPACLLLLLLLPSNQRVGVVGGELNQWLVWGSCAGMRRVHVTAALLLNHGGAQRETAR